MKAISDSLLNLIKRLMNDPMLQDFYLVGGTSLAMYLEHRISIDIDLFQNHGFDSQSLCYHLERHYNAKLIIHEINTARAKIDDVKVEFLTHDYPLLDSPQVIDGMRVADMKDLAAFKLNAVAGRGSKKDFWDIALLLDHYSLSQMLGFFSEKYASSDIWHLIKSLTYFDDADREVIDIMDLKGNTWQAIKTRVLESVNGLASSFLSTD